MTIKMPPSENNQKLLDGESIAISWQNDGVDKKDCVDASTKSECVLKRGG